MSKIIFNANEHSYTSPEIKYSSVSKLIGKFKKPYNGEYWSKYKAYQRILGDEQFKVLKKGFKMEDPTLLDYLSTMVSSDELNTVTSTILSEWEHEKDKSIIKGNTYHEFQEKLAIEQGFCISPFDNKSYTTIESTKITVEGDNEFRSPVYSNLYDLPDGFHPELILWNDTYKLAGQSDLVFIRTENDIRYIQISDYKTSKKIVKSSIFGKMSYPLNHLDCVNYNHYRLQISTYAWMLEQVGYKVEHLEFRHLNTPHRFDYMKPEVELMLENK